MRPSLAPPELCSMVMPGEEYCPKKHWRLLLREGVMANCAVKVFEAVTGETVPAASETG